MYHAIIVYHHPCKDGMAAYWLTRQALTTQLPKLDITIHDIPGQYGANQRHVFNRVVEKIKTLRETDPNFQYRVYVVDFSFPGEWIDELAQVADKVAVLDHHISAITEINKHYDKHPRPSNVHCIFDISESGASLVEKFCGIERLLTKYVKDRDLWRFEIPETKAIMAVMDAYDLAIGSLDFLEHRLTHEFNQVVAEGRMLLHYEQTILNDVVGRGVVTVEVEGYTCGLLNISKRFSSLAGEKMLEGGYPMAILWSDIGDQREYSIRTNKDSPITARELASCFGGGGHEHAAGFSYPITPTQVHPRFATEGNEKIED